MATIKYLWGRMSIRLKCVLLMGTVLTVMWLLAVSTTMYLHSFSRETDIIMIEYIDLSTFIEQFSAENVSLEDFMRPSSFLAEDARETYLAAIAKTNGQLSAMQPDSRQDTREEYALKRAICNAMKYYRSSQAALLELQDEDARIEQYLSLKTQATYIDGYARELLQNRINHGNEQWGQMSNANTATIRKFGVFMAAATVLMILALLLFTKSIIKPLTDLGRAADAISTGCYDAPPLEVQSMDELGRTARSFNQMQIEVRRTIDTLEKQAEIEKRLLEKEVEAAQMQRRLQERRFAQLQSQVNPHFLFNTLNTIAAMAQEEHAPLSENLITRLSRFFRYSLESDERLVSLGQEIRLLRDYIELQETRYGERITMEVISDPALEGLPIPKFVLQPLVENAILHGLKERATGGHIRVRVRQGRQGVTVTVTDNGCGFDTKHPPAKGTHKSVGLNNIRERMELNGGRLDVFSIPGFGTAARITIGGEHGDD